MGRKILVVEDDGDLRRMYRMALALAGFEVTEASAGLEALQLIEIDSPDLVVLDIVLPDVSGLIVQQEIAAHARTRNIPIVVVTASDLDIPDVPCVLRKPVLPDRLIETVHSCLAAGASGVDQDAGS